ncbi:HEAT repeat domain-containing protein [Flagellimonas pacifica]|uniref:HEAT repeat-containing protein n=1 Tax=Flagellimonas pacifica TaxID=1247520 RepID=A0A285MZ77_9FLAO|nr:HEAT repeat domain-containing protein [Allomuricauda parva]SNZ01096.1 HEAT repeat-containing protein [Allomuricauda parva]
MNKEQFEIEAMDFISGQMSEDKRKVFIDFLDKNPEYESEFIALSNTWKMVNSLDAPEVSARMDETFFSMLSSEIEKTKKESTWEVFAGWFPMIFRPQLVYGMMLLGVGVAIGYYMNFGGDATGVNAAIVSKETGDMRQKLVLTLLEQPSANQRLQGVSEANKFEGVDEKVITALLQTLNNDANVNVRLAAVESLTNYVHNPLVRQGLVKSIPYQESPILQVTLANLMVALQEKSSIEPFKQLMQEKKLDTTVRKKIKNSIESII